VIATQTSQELVDVSFASPTIGYALDASGGLQRTTNGGASWQTLSPGTSRPAKAVIAIGANTVLLVGPVGVYRAVAGGPFAPEGGSISRAQLSDYSLAGSAVFAFGAGTHTLIRSTNEGAKWTPVKVPLAHKASHKNGKKVPASSGVAIRSVSFTSATSGMLLDTQGRLWRTANGGRTWTEMLSVGTSSGVQLALATPADGFLSIHGFGTDSGDVYVLRTSNGGVSWHPQEITAGAIPYDGLVASGSEGGAALIDSTSVSNEPLDRLLFATSTGGDVAGTASKLSLTTTHAHYTKKKLAAAHHSVRITGTLSGAVGGEAIVVARRNLTGGSWQQQQVFAGANGGSFTTTWHVTQSSIFVAQWAGDSGRPGVGSGVLKVIVRR